MRRTASETIRNLEMRIARLEKQSRRIEIEVDEDGELVDPTYVGEECIDLEDVIHEMLDDRDIAESMEEDGLDQSDLEVGIDGGWSSRKHNDLFYFVVEAYNVDGGVVVSVDIEGESSIDFVGSHDEAWNTYKRWT